MIAGGVVVLALFVYWQSRNRAEPLVPLRVFSDRNFSLANVTISVMGFMVTALLIPYMLYAQLVRGLSPTRAALTLVPMAIMTILLARPVGLLTDRVHPRIILGFGFSALLVSMLWLSHEMTPGSEMWQLLLPMALLGIGSAAIWAPNTATATRNLPPALAGAGAGVYNATRQVGAVLGSAAIAVFMDARLSAHGLHFSASAGGSTGRLPEQVLSPFSSSMSEAILLPAALVAVGLVASALFERPRHEGYAGAAASAPAAADAGPGAAASAG
jgi:nitrate/nitrite transporter NarK